MDFQILALSAENFQHLFEFDEAALAAQNACRITVAEKPGTPCRVSLADAEIGETVILTNYTHQEADTPFQSKHAIFVREGAETVRLAKNEIPECLLHRVISIRLFDENHMMIDADIIDGKRLGGRLSQILEDPAVSYIHLHYAKPGCFAASVQRASSI